MRSQPQFNPDEAPGISRALLNLVLAMLTIMACSVGIGLVLKYKLEIDGVIEWVW